MNPIRGLYHSNSKVRAVSFIQLGAYFIIALVNMLAAQTQIDEFTSGAGQTALDTRAVWAAVEILLFVAGVFILSLSYRASNQPAFYLLALYPSTIVGLRGAIIAPIEDLYILMAFVLYLRTYKKPNLNISLIMGLVIFGLSVSSALAALVLALVFFLHTFLAGNPFRNYRNRRNHIVFKAILLRWLILFMSLLPFLVLWLIAGSRMRPLVPSLFLHSGDVQWSTHGIAMTGFFMWLLFFSLYLLSALRFFLRYDRRTTHLAFAICSGVVLLFLIPGGFHGLFTTSGHSIFTIYLLTAAMGASEEVLHRGSIFLVWIYGVAAVLISLLINLGFTYISL